MSIPLSLQVLLLACLMFSLDQGHQEYNPSTVRYTLWEQQRYFHSNHSDGFHTIEFLFNELQANKHVKHTLTK